MRPLRTTRSDVSLTTSRDALRIALRDGGSVGPFLHYMHVHVSARTARPLSIAQISSDRPAGEFLLVKYILAVFPFRSHDDNP